MIFKINTQNISKSLINISTPWWRTRWVWRFTWASAWLWRGLRFSSSLLLSSRSLLKLRYLPRWPEELLEDDELEDELLLLFLFWSSSDSLFFLFYFSLPFYCYLDRSLFLSLIYKYLGGLSRYERECFSGQFLALN